MSDSEAATRARQYYQQGLAFYQRGQHSDAVEALRLAVMTAPQHIDSRLHLATVLLGRGKGEEGLRVLESGLALNDVPDSDRIQLYEKAASCAAAINQYGLARNYLEQALRVGNLPNPRLLNQVANNCCKGGEFEIGFDYFLRAASILRDR